MPEFDIIREPLETEQRPRKPTLLEALGARVVFLSQTPYHSLYVEKETELSPQPLQPSVNQTIKNIREVVTQHTIDRPENLPLARRISLSAQMIVFTNQMPGDTFAPLEYTDIKNLKDSFLTAANEQGRPLSFDQQLDVALDLSQDDLLQALIHLCFASRQYSRWHDSTSIRDFPDFTEEQAITEMKEWRSCLLACKTADATQFQDASGDNYYAWTHALARVMYSIQPGAYNQTGKYIFERGTDIMRLTAHKIKKQKVPSDHRLAAQYGNAIGDAILSEMPPD